MTARTGCNARVSVDNDGGVLADLSAYLTGVTLTFEHQAGEYKTFYNATDEDWFQCSQCGRKASGVLRCIFDEDNTSGMEILENWWWTGGQRTVRVDHPRDVGGRSYQGEAIIIEEPIELDPASADVVIVEFSIQFCGKVTRSTVFS